MKIGTPKEVMEGEARVAMTPDSALQLQKLGHECAIETGAGARAGFTDADYKEAGVEIIKSPAALWKACDIVAKVRVPTDTRARAHGHRCACPQTPVRVPTDTSAQGPQNMPRAL